MIGKKIRYVEPTPVPFDIDAPFTLAPECATRDVVEPPLAPRAGLRPEWPPHGGEFTATSEGPRDDEGRESRDDDNDARAGNDDHRARLAHLRDLDRREREVERLERRRERLARQRRRADRRRRGHAQPDRTRRLATGQFTTGHAGDPDVPPAADRRHQQREHWQRGHVRAGDHPEHSGHFVAANPQRVRAFASGPLQGVALLVYFALLPIVVRRQWPLASHVAHGIILRGALVLLTIFWLLFLGQVVTHVRHLRAGALLHRSGSTWLAGLILVLLPFLASPSAGAQVTPSAVSATARAIPRHAVPLWSVGALPLALMAKRRGDELRSEVPSEENIDETLALLRHGDADLLANLQRLIGDAIDGVLEVPWPLPTVSGRTSDDTLAVCYLGPSDHGSLVSFARAGGSLAVRAEWTSGEAREAMTALGAGPLRLAATPIEALRALATRHATNTLVVFTGNGNELDSELRALCVRVHAYANVVTGPSTVTTPLRVELLRADPQVVGLETPFLPTLRRRCIEMAAYLALHRHEPVTGDRLRTRVLAHEDVDASVRTLSNVATALRRSLGIDERGPRLHPVTSSGRYETHGLTSDLEAFSALVGRAREVGTQESSRLCQEALRLVRSEPLSATLRGFEWFLAEGHSARLARDGEWAALAVHHEAMGRGAYDVAFWALQQGLLVDPYSDALAAALVRVPRLREFGGDGTRGAQDQPVRPSRAVAMSWSFEGFTKQVTQ